MEPPELEQIFNSFLSSGLKVAEWTAPGLEKILNSFVSSGSKVVEWTPQI